MTPEQWHRVKEVFEAALERAPSERSAFVAEACAGDDSMHSEVRSLLSSYEQEQSFMDTPAAALAAQSLMKEESAALVGQQLGHYQIIRELGRGGMGVVYLAQDLSLERPVVLKLLPGHLTSDPDRVRRFEREARTASALNHPNVCVIHEIGKTEDDRHFIAMEYIEGMTLRQQLSAKRMQLSEALHVAIQVATALAAAQKAGIVHRDIKPENIMLRSDGYVKVLDFGLAKLTEAPVFNSEVKQPLTRTDTGVVMGTAHYMSPEQARGLSVDARTDIFSLGVVIYEMVTGEVPFKGETPSHVVVAILEQEPEPLVSHWPMAPAGLQKIINKALAKNRDKRYQTFDDFLIDLNRISQRPKSESTIETAITSPARSRLITERIKLVPVSRWIWVAMAMIAVTFGLAWVYFPRRSLPPMKVTPLTSFLGFETNPTFSPDGQFIAFCWGGEKNDNIDVYIQRIGSSEPPFRLTTDPADDILPVWSPDGTQIAFSRFKSPTEKATYVIPAPWGGRERKIYTPTVEAIWGGEKNLDWSPDGKFIAGPDRLAPNGPYQITLISTETLQHRQLTFAPENSFGDLNPQFSPDGQYVSFSRLLGGGTGTADIYIVPVGGGEPRRITSDNVHIEGSTWTADGREIIFSSNRGGMMSLWRIAASGGEAKQLQIGDFGATVPTISRQGNLLAYVKKISDTNMYRLSLDRSTRNEPTRIASSTQYDGNPSFSPDGKQIAFESERSGQHEIWLSDTDGSNLIPLTSRGTISGSPIWSPDGQQIAFDSNEKGSATRDIYVVNAQGGSPRLLTPADDHDDQLPSWSNDGKWIYFSSKRSGDWQVWKVPASGGDLVQVTKQGGFLAFEAPDGKVLYYGKGITTSGIWKVPVDGGEEVPVLELQKVDGPWANWAVAKDGIYYIDFKPKNNAVIDFFNFATRKISTIASVGKVNVAWGGFGVSPDEKWAMYTLVDQEGSDIMLVENFH